VSFSPARVLAVDLGDVRIGTALSDPLGITAQPLETIAARGPKPDLRRICDLATQHEVDTLVVGLPLHLSGSESSRSEMARDWARRLGCRLPRVNVVLWDERLTSVEAERMMIGRNLSREQRRRKIDNMAAALILQCYLDARTTPEPDLECP
jgi:putative Holliday junction resolvase